LQAELSKALDSNSVLQANAAASSLKIAELDNELINLRVAVAEKLPLADRVLQLEKDAKVSALLIEEAKNAHEEALAQVVSLTAEKKVSLETLQLVQSEAEDRYNRTFKTKEEYISQVEAAESALEQTRQQLLQLQMTCNDMRSRIEEAKQNESQHMAAIRETAQKQVRHILPSCAVITKSNLISRH
jgi:thiol:disulfide interchange protein